MLKIRLADFNICIDNKYGYLQDFCREYISDGVPDFTFSVTEEEILREGSPKLDRGYLESLAIYRKISDTLPLYNAFLMHGAVADISGTGIAFLAVSGTGKTTHMMNWKALLGDKLTVVNGDKPLIRVTDNGIFAYGTPWSGKENLNSNMRTPLKKICFIERSEINECILPKDDLLKRLLVQTYRPSDVGAYFKTIDMLDRIIKSAEFYVMRCTKDVSSADIAYKKIFNKEKNNDKNV